MTEIYPCQKYKHATYMCMYDAFLCMHCAKHVHVRNKCMSKYICVRNISACQKYMYDRNIYPCRHATSNFLGQERSRRIRALLLTFCRKHQKKRPRKEKFGSFFCQISLGQERTPPPPLSSPLVARLPCQKYISMSEMYAYQKYICKYFQKSMHVRNILYACQKDFHIFLEVYGI